MKKHFLTGFGVLALISGSLISVIIYLTKQIKHISQMKDRFKNYYDFSLQWIDNKNKKYNISTYCKDKGYNKIALYGIGSIGERVVNELKGTDVKVLYAIQDIEEEDMFGDLTVYPLDGVNEREKTDVIIVTPFYDFDNIHNALMDSGVDTEIISIEDIIYNY